MFSKNFSNYIKKINMKTFQFEKVVGRMVLSRQWVNFINCFDPVLCHKIASQKLGVSLECKYMLTL